GVVVREEEGVALVVVAGLELEAVGLGREHALLAATYRLLGAHRQGHLALLGAPQKHGARRCGDACEAVPALGLAATDGPEAFLVEGGVIGRRRGSREHERRQ